jgi:predicted RNA methylase
LQNGTRIYATRQNETACTWISSFGYILERGFKDGAKVIDLVAGCHHFSFAALAME